MNRLILPACLVLLVLSGSAIAQDFRSTIGQDNRFALVIGNGNYEQGQLKNPASDAKLISKSLTDLGFQVESKTDLDQQEMEETISSFSRRLPKNSFAFFFFAGHGIQAKKANYLIPVGATLNSESSLKYRTVPLDFVRDELENSKSNLNVVVLDCCRNNPFERSWNRALGQRGFAPVPPVPEGTVIAFATGAGKTAADGQGNNSPYTRELASALSARPPEGLSLVEGVFFTLGRTLKPKTQQHPHLYVDSTMPKYYLWEPSADDVAKTSRPGAEIAKSELPPSPAMTSPAMTSPTVPSPTSMKSAIGAGTLPRPKSSHGHDLLAQALRYHSEGEFDYAITAFGALITDPDISREVRDQARKGRGGSYLAKGTAESINRAIIDFKAAREPGVQLSVMRSEAELKDAKVVTGKVQRNEIVLLTQSKGDWLWVESVQGSKSRQGWIKCSAFLASPTSSDSASVSIVLPNKGSTSPNSVLSNNTSVQPTTAGVSQSEPVIAPLGTSPTPFNSSASSAFSPSQSSTIRYGTDGRPIGSTPTQSSQQLRFDQSGNVIQPWSGSSSNGAAPQQQVQSYQVDQYGNRISSAQRSAPVSQQSNVIYYDQNGRQIVPGNQQNQSQFRTSPATNQQQVYQPRQQVYKPQQQTYQPQQQQTFRTQQTTKGNSNSGFGNQSRPSLPFQNQGNRGFKSPMRSHMDRMKSFGFGN